MKIFPMLFWACSELFLKKKQLYLYMSDMCYWLYEQNLYKLYNWAHRKLVFVSWGHFEMGGLLSIDHPFSKNIKTKKKLFVTTAPFVGTSVYDLAKL